MYVVIKSVEEQQRLFKLFPYDSFDPREKDGSLSAFYNYQYRIENNLLVGYTIPYYIHINDVYFYTLNRKPRQPVYTVEEVALLKTVGAI